ncbi:MAG: hypothetical protein HY899_12970 [Deltaproteobacteria bacterium]|nr:hypothetical protein [Deltaproteobacteria bacterium]
MSGAGDPPRVLGRYDEDDLLRMFTEAGAIAAVERRGFSRVGFELDGSSGALVHARLLASKHGDRYPLLDACLTELSLAPDQPTARGFAVDAPVELVVVYWLREQDPTVEFDALHSRLPLQEHPGLGLLRRAFRVAVRIGREMGKDGIAALPKFFHDAAIFYRSRLFLFLDPREQGRLEALIRDLGGLSLADATLAFLADAVRDADGAVVRWSPTLQVLPISPTLVDAFHSQAYQAANAQAFETARFTWDAEALANARRVFEVATPARSGS